MTKLLLILFAIPLFGASLIIDSGESTDQLFSGGNAYAIPNPPAGLTDTTLRFGGSFSYQIPATDGIPYVVKMNFIEPSSAPPVRSFSVTINDELVLTKSAMAGYLVPFSRSVVAMSADGFLNIHFDSVFHSTTHLPAFRSGPVISSIEITPIFQVLGTTLPIVTAWSSCHGSGVLAGPDGPGTPPGALWPGLFTAPPGWNCDGLQAYTFTMPDGSLDGPYIAVKMPPEFAFDPAIWIKQ